MTHGKIWLGIWSAAMFIIVMINVAGTDIHTDPPLGVGWFFVVSIIIGIFYANSRKKKDGKLKDLKNHYDETLKSTDKTLALNAGRAYYASLRDEGILTPIDEQSIKNDLSTMNVATITPTKAPEEKKSPSSDNVIEQLEKLAQLKEKGILTDEEFKAQKAKLL